MVKSGPGIRAPESAKVNEAAKIVAISSIIGAPLKTVRSKEQGARSKRSRQLTS